MAGLGASFSMENNNEFFFTAARTMLEVFLVTRQKIAPMRSHKSGPGESVC